MASRKLKMGDLEDLAICDCGNIFLESGVTEDENDESYDLYCCSACAYRRIDNEELDN